MWTVLRSGLLLSLLVANKLWAHGADDHNASAPPAGALTEQAQRLLTGAVYVPKGVQFLWQVQTEQAIAGQWPQYVELPATVVLNPAAQGLVEAAQLGRLSAGPSGYPAVGQPVSEGQVLAYLQPADSTLDRSNQQALLAELSAQIRLTQERINRLSRLGTLVAQSELDNARIELTGLQQRYTFAQKATGTLLPIVAPVAGTVSVVHKQAGQYVEAQQPLFLILHPQSLLIEALSYANPTQPVGQSALLQLPPGTPATAQSIDGQQQWPVQLSGVAGALRQQALPLYFQPSAGANPVLLGQTLAVRVALPSRQHGILLPADAVLRRDNGDTVVWQKIAPEQFRQQQVVIQPASAGQVLVSAGLAADALVVVRGAGYLMQVR